MTARRDDRGWWLVSKQPRDKSLRPATPDRCLNIRCERDYRAMICHLFLNKNEIPSIRKIIARGSSRILTRREGEGCSGVVSSECIITFNLIFIHSNLWKLTGWKGFSFVAVIFYATRCDSGHLFGVSGFSASPYMIIGSADSSESD